MSPFIQRIISRGAVAVLQALGKLSFPEVQFSSSPHLPRFKQMDSLSFFYLWSPLGWDSLFLFWRQKFSERYFLELMTMAFLINFL